MSLSTFISPRQGKKNVFVIIDARYSIYEYRSKADVIYSNVLKQFIVQLNEMADFLFCFFHKNQTKNQLLIKQFQDYCTTNQLPLKDQILVCQKNEINQYLLIRIKEYIKNNQQVTPFDVQRNRAQSLVISKTLESLNNKSQNILMISHNPISFKFANILTQILKETNFQQFNLAMVLYSSYFQNIRKKQIIEEHFYKYNYKSKAASNCYFDHISILNQIVPYLTKGYTLLKNKESISVGYYFYPKKLYDLFQKEILNNSMSIRMIPVDLRFYNTFQYDQINVIETLTIYFLQVFFQKILDLNKKKEIKFTEDEVEIMKGNYDKFITDYKGKIANIDPIHTIPIIGERQKFQDKFQEIIQSFKFKYFIKQNNIALQFMVPKQIIIYQDQHSNGKTQFQMNYPIIVKSLEACFTPNCHIMSIVTHQQAFNELKKDKNFKGNLLIQEIINHDALIYKVYCLGKQVIIQKRKSIPNITLENFKSENGYHIFDSQKNFHEEVKKCLNYVEDNNYQNEELDHEKDLRKCIQQLSELISEAFEVKLFGYDIIGDLKKKQFYLIDINHFPGYKNVNVPKIKDMFDNLFLESIE